MSTRSILSLNWVPTHPQYLPCCKLNSYCAFAFEIKFIACKPGQQVTFANARITDEHHCNRNVYHSMTTTATERCIQASTISTGSPAFFSRRAVRASDTQLLLARTGHKVFVRDTQVLSYNAGPNDNPACGFVSALPRSFC